MGVDLHIHTTYSDGAFTPEEVVKYANYKGLRAIAITDHDTVLGNEEGIDAGNKLGIRVIPGVEISVCYEEKEIHILGYFIDYRSNKLIESLERLKNSRRYRNPKIIEKLKKFGIEIDLDNLKEKLGTENICRPHIASEMVKLGYVSSVKEAFDLYLRVGKPAYVPKEQVKVEDAINLIKESGGVSVLAHPTTLNLGGRDEYHIFFKELKEKGLDGVEVFYDGRFHPFVDEIADKFELVKTAGSDFHGVKGNGNNDMICYPDSILENLEKRRRVTYF